MERVLNITLSIVGVSLGLFLLAFVAGFAYDIERSPEHETGQNSMKEAPMSASILVAYATSSGSTQEVAEVVAATLRDEGFAVDLQPMRDMRTIGGYSAVVLGAPLYMFHWHKDALRFLARHREDLRELPVAVFALGPFHDDEKEWQEVRAQLDKELAKFPWFAPVAIEIVGGKFDPAKLRFPLNLVPALKQMPASDIRDWTAIRAWASNLATQFQPALAH
jgi:menaquinone-dependent protoporphyrinogen oxidase